jgi:hypothetical protein
MLLWSTPENCLPLVTDHRTALVARGVSERVVDELFFPVHARYFLNETGALYIRKVPGGCHATLHARIILGKLVNGWGANGLDEAITPSSAVIGQYGNTRAEPDAGIFAPSDGGAASPRAVVKIEVAHRSKQDSREQAGRYVLDPSVRLLMLVKVWKWRAPVDGAFAATYMRSLDKRCG